MPKKPVYNGYEEQYLNGYELKELFQNKYYTSGRHHSVVLAISIPQYLTCIRIDDSKLYRIFINAYFCRIMKADTDGLVTFFGYTNLENIGLNHNREILPLDLQCPLCNSRMDFKNGKFGEFLGCSNYPNCRFTKKIPIIGNSVG